METVGALTPMKWSSWKGEEQNKRSNKEWG